MQIQVKTRNPDMKTFTDEMRNQVLNELCEYTFARSQENLLSFGASDTGFLLKSGRRDISGKKKFIIYDAPYAADVEYGTRPHFPPVEAIQAWVKRKLHVKDEKKSKEIAFSICQAISVHGTKARPYIRNALNELDYVKFSVVAGKIRIK